MDARSGTIAGSLLAIDGLADETERYVAAVDRLGMSDAQVSARREQAREALYEALARALIEIDHHVAAEDDVERAAHRPVVHEIQGSERHQRAQLVFHERIPRMHTAAFAEVATQPFLRYGSDAIE